MCIRDVEAAAARLQGIIHPTAVSTSSTFSAMADGEIHLKCENLQKTGSFKVRGAYNKIAKLREEGNITRVVASSAGNHAQGVAFASTQLGIESTIVMPLGAPIAKIAATEGYGAKVVLWGSCYDDAYLKAMEIKEETGAVFIHPFEDEDIMAGQATVALEIFHQLPTVDTVLIPAGGGGLLAGMASYIKEINPRVRVVGVQAAGVDPIVRSFHGNTYLSAVKANTIADGIAVKTPGRRTVEVIQRYVDDMITVTDAQIAEAILLLLERTKLVVEPAGAVALAAAIHKNIDLSGQKALCVLSGGNIDVGLIHKVVEKGLVSRGRQMKIRTVMLDAPGSLQKFAALIAQCGANVIMVQHDRIGTGLNLGEAILHTACEVSGPEHARQVISALEQNGYQVSMEL